MNITECEICGRSDCHQTAPETPNEQDVPLVFGGYTQELIAEIKASQGQGQK